MAVRSQKRVVRSKKNATCRVKKNVGVRRWSKKKGTDKVAILEQSGLMGCLTGTGVTSKNYKDLLLKE